MANVKFHSMMKLENMAVAVICHPACQLDCDGREYFFWKDRGNRHRERNQFNESRNVSFKSVQ